MIFDMATEMHSSGAVIVRLEGQFDFSHVATARAAFNQRIDGGATIFVVNLDGLEYIDSAGLGLLVGTLARLRDRQGVLSVVCRSPRIRRVFDITRLTQLIALHESEEEALSSAVPAVP